MRGCSRWAPAIVPRRALTSWLTSRSRRERGRAAGSGATIARWCWPAARRCRFATRRSTTRSPPCPRAQRASGAVPRRTAARRLCRLHRNPKLVVGTRAAILLSSRGSHRLHRRRRSDAGDTQEAGAGRRSAARTGLRRRVQPGRLRRSIRTRGFTRFHWKDRIRFSVVNPEVASAWPIETARADDFNPRTRVRRVLIAAAAGLFAVRRRLRAARRSRSKPPPRGR